MGYSPGLSGAHYDFFCVLVCVCMCVLTKFTFLREKCGKSQNNHSGKV